jgi:hypothetical protein
MSTTPPKIAQVGTVKRRLMTKLTEKEREDRGILLAVQNLDIANLEEKMKSVAKDYKDQIGGLQASARFNASVVSKGEEMRDVECTVYYGQPDKKHKKIVRNDTNEVVCIEEMSPSDMQPKLIVTESEPDEEEAAKEGGEA